MIVIRQLWSWLVILSATLRFEITSLHVSGYKHYKSEPNTVIQLHLQNGDSLTFIYIKQCWDRLSIYRYYIDVELPMSTSMSNGIHIRYIDVDTSIYRCLRADVNISTNIVTNQVITDVFSVCQSRISRISVISFIEVQS